MMQTFLSRRDLFVGIAISKVNKGFNEFNANKKTFGRFIATTTSQDASETIPTLPTVYYEWAVSFTPVTLPPPLPEPKLTGVSQWAEPFNGEKNGMSGSLSSSPEVLNVQDSLYKDKKNEIKSEDKASSTKKKNTLFLDIDETLICTNESPIKITEDHTKIFGDVIKTDRDFSIYNFTPRPDLGPFLREVTQLFEVVFWTTASYGYGAGVIHSLERFFIHPESFSYLYTPEGLRESFCKENIAKNTVIDDFPKSHRVLSSEYYNELAKRYRRTDENHGKEFSALNYYLLAGPGCSFKGGNKFIPFTGRSLRNSLMIDNLSRSFTYIPRNAVLIDSFYSSKSDRSLSALMPLLRAVSAADDVSEELNHWRHDDYVCFDELKYNEWYGTYNRHKNTGLKFGEVLPERRLTPIKPLCYEYVNKKILFEDYEYRNFSW